MKKLSIYSILAFGLLFGLSNCDKIENAYVPAPNSKLDTSLYPGDWEDYLNNEYPTFTDNPNTNVNVLVEDYTGHTCINCPTAADVAHSMHEGNPNRIFVASIHIDPGAQMSFQQFYPNDNKYYTDHTNPDGVAYGIEFQSGFNFWGNPQGTVSRKTVNDALFALTGTWESRAAQILNENNLKVNIQSVFNYYSATDGGFLHAEFEKLTNDPLDLNAVVYVLQDSLVDWQKMPDNSDNPDYIHRDKHLGSIDNNPWGVPVFDASNAMGDKIILDYSYKLPASIDKENLHFLIYVYDVDTYEILHVIKQEIEE